MTRLFRWLWLGLILVSSGLLTLQSRQGFQIDTSFSAMVPVPDDEQAQVEVLGAARDQADRGIILLLSSTHPAQLEGGYTAITELLDQHKSLLSRSRATSLPDGVMALLKAHQFQLLSDAHLQQLRSGAYQAFLADTISSLYTATGELRVLDFNKDPFNTLGSFVEQQLSRNLPVVGQNQRIINLRLLPGSQERRAQRALEVLFRDIDSLVQREFPQVQLARSGVYFFASHAAQGAKQDINLISTGSMLGLLILMVVVFRSIWPVLLPVVSILSGVLAAFAMVHAIYGSVHVFTIVFGASLIGIVIDYSIHYFFHIARFQSSANSQGGGRQALLRALLVSLVTSVVGYSALALSGLELLEKIAVFSVCGVVAAWLTVLSFAPGVQHRVAVHTSILRSLQQGLSIVGAALNRYLTAVPIIALTGMAIVIITLLAKVQDDPRKFVKLPAELLQESQQVSAAFQGIEPGRYLLAQGVDEQALFAVLSELYQRSDGGSGLVSIFNWMPSPQQQQDNYQMLAALYKAEGQTEGLARSLYRSLGMDDSAYLTLQQSYQDNAEQQMSAQALLGSAEGALPGLLHISEDTHYASVYLTKQADIDTLKSIAAQLPGIDYVDAVAQSMTQLEQQRRMSALMLLLAYLVVGVMLLLLYRRLRCLSMLLIPAIATLISILILVLFGVPFTLFHTMALFLILGLGMDYAVFLTEMTEDQSATLQAILLSAMTSMLSFGLLALSSVPVAQAFGVTVFLGNSLNLLLAFTLAGGVFFRGGLARTEQGSISPAKLAQSKTRK